MDRVAKHRDIVALHKDIKRFHKGINGFCRFNYDELADQFRNGVATPALALSSHSAALEINPNGSTTFNAKDISFLLVDYTGKPDEYDKQEVVLDALEDIALDIATYLEKLSKDPSHWLYGLFDRKSFKYEKVGPLWDSMYGWNVMYQLKNKESMVLDPERWDFNAI